MAIDTQTIRTEAHSRVGLIITQNAAQLIERWSERAIAEQPNAERIHHDVLRNHLGIFLQAMGKRLMQANASNGHCLPALDHGEQRWEAGWSLPELVRDYQILRLVLLDFLTEVLDQPLEIREILAIGLALDEAISASVRSYVESRTKTDRRLQQQQRDQDQKAQDELRRQTEALRAADTRKNEFVATLAHELRNPLAPIRNAVAVLRLHPIDDPIVHQVRDLIDRQVAQMTRLVDDLLDVSRIAEGKIQLHKGPIDVANLVNQVVPMAEPLMKSRQHRFEVSLPSRSLWLDGDQTRLIQVIINLLNNAAKYTDRGGTIWLTVDGDNSQVIIRVRDTGVGIAPDLLQHVFDLFTQAEWPADTTQGGLGIGLTLVRRLVELHGGTIEAHSPGVNQGSEFVVRLPEARPQEEQLSPCEPVPESIPARHILIIEDNADGRESLEVLLSLLGHRVEVAEDGVKGVARALESKPELALIDIGLPTLDGYQVAQQIRATLGKSIILIALTGYSQPDDIRRAEEAGFDAHLRKPVDLPALQRVLATPR